MERFEGSSNKPVAFIVDLDGTLFDPSHRQNELVDFDAVTNRDEMWDKFNSRHVDDRPYDDTLSLLYMLKKSATLIFVTARSSKFKGTTRSQLIKYLLGRENDLELFMRAEGDRNSDADVKRDIYFNEIEKRYNVLGVFEDRETVVQMWRGIGLTCYQPRPSPY